MAAALGGKKRRFFSVSGYSEDEKGKTKVEKLFLDCEKTANVFAKTCQRKALQAKKSPYLGG